MFTAEEIMQLIQSLIWLLAGVGIFIVGMNFMSLALEQSAGDGILLISVRDQAAFPLRISQALHRAGAWPCHT